MDKLVAVFIFGVMIATFLFTLKKGKYKAITSRKSDDNLDNLNRMQTYEFWRDFGKRGEQKKTQ